MLFTFRREMTSFVDQYYNINRKFLTIVGLWPYQKWRSRIFQITLFPCVLMAFLIAQVLAQAFPCFIYFLTYIAFVWNHKEMKISYERVYYEWMIVKAADEIDILKKYAEFSKQFAVITTVLLLLFLNSFGIFQFLPALLDFITPLNESREHHFTFLAEYFVDQERYFYPILTHSLFAIYVGCTAVVSTGSMLMAFVLHICAMLKIASYRLEHISDNISPISKSEKDYIMYERIVSAVDTHRRALEFAEYLVTSFMKFYFVLIGVGISSLTVNMFQLLQFMMVSNDTNGMLACALLIIAHFIYMFMGNFAGQIITDHNTNIFYKTYTQWYTVSLRTQRMLLFVMQRSMKNYYCEIGGVFAASLEGFATLMSMSLSYFTMIYSTR
ncbi:PREDICTED: uncharacterized protein LOC105558321 [Vollenhovia emeryi]|uniref:uncharacterized protein LOC105558321 n=1 Tax=Vollenhovia emeryi TaxID=411798 RepID=UPI0005F38D02|nr:PREDICTED: uncharacterized protein LOC105558321 [Vollenhovia emeryi]